MPKFSAKSKALVAKLHPSLQAIVNEAIKEYDFTVMDSTRGRAAQELAYKRGNSKARFGQSAHNYQPAIAVDLAPYPVDFDNVQRFKDLAKIVLRIAKEKGIPLRWGGDWNMDGSTSDGWDFPHFELHPWKTYAAKSTLVKD
jgi:peptidoglycan L-alanyl-D-glutamate endopeptidase CwlK